MKYQTALFISLVGCIEPVTASQVGPTLRSGTGHCVAYDVARGQTILFGDGETDVPITWGQDNSGQWRNLAAGTPASRIDCAMAYHADLQKIIMFGGIAGHANDFNRSKIAERTLKDTWLWDGTSWTEHTGEGPPATSGAAFVYDSVHKRIILFGGLQDCSGSDCQKTWAFDASGWSLLHEP